MTGGLPQMRKQRTLMAQWCRRVVGICALESDCLGSHPRPALSRLWDTHQVASPFCAPVSPCTKGEISSCLTHDMAVAVKTLSTVPGMEQMVPK